MCPHTRLQLWYLNKNFTICYSAISLIADSNWSISEFIDLTGFCIFRRLGLIRRKSVAPASGNPGRNRFSKSHV